MSAVERRLQTEAMCPESRDDRDEIAVPVTAITVRAALAGRGPGAPSAVAGAALAERLDAAHDAGEV